MGTQAMGYRGIGTWAMRPIGAKGYRGMGHMANKAHRGSGVQRVWVQGYGAHG